jgi:hypothetical protein
MTTSRRHVPHVPSQLLSRIMERPALVAAVRDLPAAALSRLIDRVGLEDSAELVALASTEQLTALLDEDLWRTDESGFEERFDPARFAQWLRAMAEAGDEFLVRRLCELPQDLLTLAVNRLVLVIDSDALRSFYLGARDEAGQVEVALEHAPAEEWEEFLLIARDLDAWETVWDALLLLDRDHHQRLRAILEQCCAMSTEYISGQGGLYEVLTSDEMLESDVRGVRDDQRAMRGYVALSDARAFLALARDGRQPLAQRDALTTAYFRALDNTRGRPMVGGDARRLPPASARADIEELLQLIDESDAAPHPRRSDGARFARESTRSGARPPTVGEKHEAVLVGAARAEHPATSTREPERTSSLAAALAELASVDPTMHAVRTEELGYLANVVLAGCTHDARKLRPVEALEVAIATCSLGLDLWERAGSSHTSHRNDARVLQEVGCDRLFRAAWSTLQRDVVEVAGRVLSTRSMRLGGQRARAGQKLIVDGAASSLRALCEPSELGLAEEELEELVALASSLPQQRQTTPGAKGVLSWFASAAALADAQRRLAEFARVG